MQTSTSVLGLSFFSSISALVLGPIIEGLTSVRLVFVYILRIFDCPSYYSQIHLRINMFRLQKYYNDTQYMLRFLLELFCSSGSPRWQACNNDVHMVIRSSGSRHVLVADYNFAGLLLVVAVICLSTILKYRWYFELLEFQKESRASLLVLLILATSLIWIIHLEYMKCYITVVYKGKEK